LRGIASGVFSRGQTVKILRGVFDPAENSGIVSHPFPQKTRKWMGHTDSIQLPDQFPFSAVA
jgi:hypothetical protein